MSSFLWGVQHPPPQKQPRENTGPHLSAPPPDPQCVCPSATVRVSGEQQRSSLLTGSIVPEREGGRVLLHGGDPLPPTGATEEGGAAAWTPPAAVLLLLHGLRNPNQSGGRQRGRCTLGLGSCLSPTLLRIANMTQPVHTHTHTHTPSSSICSVSNC